MTGRPGRLEATVKGRVQGVGFRWFVSREASGLELTGGVRNLSDGTVEVVAEGRLEALTALLEALRRGPSGSHVTDIQHSFLPPSGTYATFEIWPSR